VFYVKTVKKQVQFYLIRLKRFIIYSYIYLRVHRAGAFDTMLLPSPLLFLCRFKRHWRLCGLSLIGGRIFHSKWFRHSTQAHHYVMVIILLVHWLFGVWFRDPLIL